MANVCVYLSLNDDDNHDNNCDDDADDEKEDDYLSHIDHLKVKLDHKHTEN